MYSFTSISIDLFTQIHFQIPINSFLSLIEINKFLAGIRFCKNHAISMLLRFCTSELATYLANVSISLASSRLFLLLAEKDKDIFLISSENNFSRATSSTKWPRADGELCTAPTRPRISRRYTNKQRKRGRQAER